MKLYSFEETTLIVNGAEITGFTDDDDSLIVRRLEDSFFHVTGNKGEMAVSLRASRAGEFVIKLQQTSEDNAAFSLLIGAAENGAFVPVAVLFKDNLGNDLMTGTKGYLRRPADATRGTPVQTQEWSIVVERLDMILGGSGDV